MRRAVPHPRNLTTACAACGKTGGLLWESVYRVLEVDQVDRDGKPVVPVIVEPDDLGEPVRCEACERPVREAAWRAFGLPT